MMNSKIKTNAQAHSSLEALTVIAAILCLGLSLVACGGPEPEIRATLSERERVVFDRGRTFSTPCWPCHDLYGEQNKIGPYLSGLYGRRAGSIDFAGFSDAMKSSNFIWDDRTLRAYLASPMRFVPGTTMNATGPPDRADLDALVFYLGLVTARTGDAN